MGKTAFILIAGIFAHILFMTSDAGAEAPLHGGQFVHEWASETPLLDEKAEDVACLELTPVPVSRELHVGIHAEFILWPHQVCENDPQPLASQPSHYPPDIARALFQVYRI